MKFSQIIDNSFIGKIADKKVGIWERLNPEKFYVENIRHFFNLSHRIAKILCEVAARQGFFEKKFEVLCPNEGRSIGEFDRREQIPETIECKNCEILEKNYHFKTSDCIISEFYRLAKK